jgi:transaldolase
MDSLSREMLETGELTRLMEEDAVVGVTSNPTIFEKALSPATGATRSSGCADTARREEIFSTAVEDVARACDLLRRWMIARRDGISIESTLTSRYDREASYDGRSGSTCSTGRTPT